MRKIYAAAMMIFLTVSLFSQTYTRKVLFEEATNASCGPCAINNPLLKAYIESKGDTIIAIKYHSNIPGFDPMYFHNVSQNVERYSAYYNMNLMPWLNVDGLINDVWPFNQTNFDNAYYGRLAIQSPLLVTVTDQRVAADSIKTTITVNKPAGLPSGNYKLRVMAIEKKIIYNTAPGSNGETVFEHVFRRAYPNTAGSDVNVSAGTENFSFTYHIHADWKDTSVYTVAFVQNDNNKEVMNVGKGNTTIIGVNTVNSEVPSAFALSQNYPNPFNPVTNINFSIPKSSFITLKVFDMLSREVSSLVNEQMTAGNYKVDWNANSSSSGIYFYTITAGDYKETKKMMLIK